MKKSSSRNNILQDQLRFLRIASHILRTPISVISWNSEMLLGSELGNLSDIQIEAIRSIAKNNHKLLDRVETILLAFELEYGIHETKLATVELDKLLVAEVCLLKPERRAHVSLAYDRRSAYCLHSDSEIIAYAVNRLLDNAFLYADRTSRINLSLKRIKDAFEIRVRNRGEGIPADQINLLFSRFFRADNAVRLEPDGSGLSLYNTKMMLKLIKASISADSNQKQTTFTIKIPNIKHKEEYGHR